MRVKRLVIWALVLLNLSIVLLFFWKLNFKSKNESVLKNVSEPYKEYVYEPTYATYPIFQAPVNYPFIKTPPWDIKYAFLTFREEFHLNTKRYDELFFAEKRIAEVLLWGKNLSVSRDPELNKLVHKKTDRNSVVNSLKKWWKNQLLKKYDSWEASFVRYLSRVENRIEELSKSKLSQKDLNSEKIYLASHLKAHYIDVNKTIRESGKSQEDRKYLSYINTSIFNYLNNKTLDGVSTINENQISLSLIKPFVEKEFGLYDIFIFDVPDRWRSLSPITLKGGNRVVDLTTSNEGLMSSDLEVSKNTKSSEKVLIDYPRIDLAGNIIWTWDRKNKDFQAEIDSDGFDRYLIHIESNQTEPYLFKVLEIKRAIIRGRLIQHSSELINEEINPQGKKVVIERNFSTSSKNKDFILRLVIIPKKKISSLNPYQTSLKLFSMTDPLIVLKKKAPLSVQKNIAVQDNFFLTSALRFLVYIDVIFVLLFISTFIFRKTKKYYEQLRRLIRYLRYPLLILFVIGLLFDIFVYKNYSSIIFLSLTFTWLLIVIGFQLQELTGYNLALFFLIAVPFFVFSGRELIADKIAVWSFNLIILSSISFLWTVEKPVLYAPRSFTLIRTILTPIELVFSGIDKFIKRLIRLTKNFVLSLFNMQPETFWDHLLNYIKAIILTIFVILLVYGISVAAVLVNKQVQIRREKEIQLSRHPKISSIEPRIVYFSTKVVLKGTNFGWLQKDKVRLFNDGEPVVADFWSDNKIIFTVPLHWKLGTNNLWIKKRVLWKDKSYDAQSNIIELKVIPRTNSFTEQDDEYFNQLKYLDKETLQINGYR